MSKSRVRFADEGASRRGPTRTLFALVLVLAFATLARAAQEVSSFTIGVGDITAVTNGQILIGKTSDHTFTLGTITAGSNVTVTNGAGTITIAATSGSTNALLDGSNHTDTTAGTVARGDLITGQGGTPTWTRLAKGSTGKFFGSDGTDVAWHTLAGTSNQITVNNSSGDLTIATPQDIGTSSAVSFGSVQAKLLTSAKTADYSVSASTDIGKIFRTTGAGGTVIFTLPTSADGLVFGFYVDAAQTLEILAPASTTIQVGGSVTTAAGNITSSTVGHFVWVLGLGSNKYACFGAMGSWTTA